MSIFRGDDKEIDFEEEDTLAKRFPEEEEEEEDANELSTE